MFARCWHDRVLRITSKVELASANSPHFLYIAIIITYTALEPTTKRENCTVMTTSNPNNRFNKSLTNDAWLNADLFASNDYMDFYSDFTGDETNTGSSMDYEQEFPTEIRDARPNLSDAGRSKQDKSKSGRGRAETNKKANEPDHGSRHRPESSSVSSTGRGHTEKKKGSSEGSPYGRSAGVLASRRSATSSRDLGDRSSRGSPPDRGRICETSLHPQKIENNMYSFCLKGPKIDTPKGRIRSVTAARDQSCPDDDDASVMSSSSKLMRPRLSIRSLGLESPRRQIRKKHAVCRLDHAECPTDPSKDLSSSGNDDICKAVLDKSDSDRPGDGTSIETNVDDDARSQVRPSRRHPARKIAILDDIEVGLSVVSSPENSKTKRDDPLRSRNRSARARLRENKLSVHLDRIASSGENYNRASSSVSSPARRQQNSSQLAHHFNSSSDSRSVVSVVGRRSTDIGRSSSSVSSPAGRQQQSSPLAHHFNSSSRSVVSAVGRRSTDIGRTSGRPMFYESPTKSMSGEKSPLQRSVQSADSHFNSPTDDMRSVVSGVRNTATGWKSSGCPLDMSPTKLMSSQERPQFHLLERLFCEGQQHQQRISGVSPIIVKQQAVVVPRETTTVRKRSPIGPSLQWSPL
jgi:hypothetical protein